MIVFCQGFNCTSYQVACFDYKGGKSSFSPVSSEITMRFSYTTISLAACERVYWPQSAVYGIQLPQRCPAVPPRARSQPCTSKTPSFLFTITFVHSMCGWKAWKTVWLPSHLSTPRLWKALLHAVRESAFSNVSTPKNSFVLCRVLNWLTFKFDFHWDSFLSTVSLTLLGWEHDL